MRYKLIVALFVSALFFVTCDSNRVAEQWVDIPASGWMKDSVCVFQATLEDTTQFVDLQVGIRNESTYPYSNLWMFVSIISPQNEVHVDTFQVNLSDASGKWYGSGWGDLYTVVVPYRTSLRFIEQGEYTFQIKQGMRHDVLKGISSIGLRIQKSDAN